MYIQVLMLKQLKQMNLFFRRKLGKMLKLIKWKMGMLKGKTAIKLFKNYPDLKRKPYWGNHFWSRGYCVSIIGLDENKIRKCVKYQEEREKREEATNKNLASF